MTPECTPLSFTWRLTLMAIKIGYRKLICLSLKLYTIEGFLDNLPPQVYDHPTESPIDYQAVQPAGAVCALT